MDKLKKTKQTFTLVTILATATVFSYILFFNSVKEKNETISLITNDVDIAVQKEIRLKSAKGLIKDTQDSRFKLDNYFVTDDRIVDFIEDVENIGRYTGADVKVISVNVDEGGNIKSYISELLRLDFEVKGEWEEVFKFLLLVEKIPFKVDFSTVSLHIVYGDDTNKNNSGAWKGFFSMSAVKLK